MTVIAVGFVPAAPLLVPAVAGGSAALDERLRQDCRVVVEALIASEPDSILVLAAAENQADVDRGTWDFKGFGVPREDRDPTTPSLPWQLGIGSWLLDDVGWRGTRRYVTVAASSPPVVAGDHRVAVLAIGDGTACRSDKAPGHLDDRAAGFDEQIAQALTAGDAQRLAGLDSALAAKLMCTGQPVWQAVAGVLRGEPSDTRLLSAIAPYGVAYFAAIWQGFG